MRAAFALSLLVGSLASCVVRSDPPLSDRDGGPMPDTTIDTGPPDAPFACSPGLPGCFGGVHYVCGADGRTRTDEITCGEACDATLGCVTCVPDSRRCTGTVSERCDATGSRWSFGRDCADWNVACGANGYCDDDCASAEAQRSYVGCEYYATPLANFSFSPGPRDFDFRVVLANPSPHSTQVTITHGQAVLARQTLVAGAIVDIRLPWIDGATFPFDGGPFQSHVTSEAAYRILASRPIIATQFNPFEYVHGREYSFSNDASLLYPVHALGTEYVALSVPPLSVGGSPPTYWPGYVGVLGTTPEPAAVTVVSPVDVAADASGRWPATPANTSFTFMLARGELAQITPAVPPTCGPDRPVAIDHPTIGWTCSEAAYDISGARITSDRPIAAFGGHACAYVPFDVVACDHLEESLAPVATWGTHFETVPLADPSMPSQNLVRLLAARDGTQVTLDPPPAGTSASIDLVVGVPFDVRIDGPLAIVASQPIEVGQFLMGQNLSSPPATRGDPAMTMLVPREQNRFDYELVAPTSYAPIVNGQSWLVVTRDPGAAITLDDEVLDATWQRVGDREIATIPVDGGAHRASASSAFGLVAFGLGTYTSYAYPAGLDLRVILR